MKIPDSISVYGCKVPGCKISESHHLITFFNILRKDYPDFAAIALHIRNEGNRTYYQTAKHKMEGMVTGACDIILPGNPSFCCELKSQASSSRISKEQINYLVAAKKNGSFVCIAYGWEAAIQAFQSWLKLQLNNPHHF